MVTAFPSSIWDTATLKAPGFGVDSSSESHQCGNEAPTWQGTQSSPSTASPVAACRAIQGFLSEQAASIRHRGFFQQDRRLVEERTHTSGAGASPSFPGHTLLVPRTLGHGSRPRCSGWLNTWSLATDTFLLMVSGPWRRRGCWSLA